MLPKGKDGMIDLVFGPMFAGKSTELLRRIKRYRVASKSCLVIKYANDTRYSDKCVSTHDQQMIEAVSCDRLMDVQEKALDFDIIGIDEGQFFEDIVEFSEQMANEGKMVIIAALDGTFERKAFGKVLELIPLAESITKLDAVCVDCKHSASFTKRLCDSKETELIGGAEIYKPVCRGCYNKDEGIVADQREKVNKAQSLSDDDTYAKDVKICDKSLANPSKVVLRENKNVVNVQESVAQEDKENMPTQKGSVSKTEGNGTPTLTGVATQ